MNNRYLSPLDRLVDTLDQGLRVVFGRPPTTGRPHPAKGAPESTPPDRTRKEVARLMRINHCGEVCAQALYQGQALTAKLPTVRDDMRRAAEEENDHLNWCHDRLDELGSHTSILNPLFYAGAFTLGALAGIAGDKWSLGFVAETEDQVVRHLDGHLERLPVEDQRSRAILLQMKIDEGQHAGNARRAGGVKLPLPVRLAMRAGSRIMTSTTYWI